MILAQNLHRQLSGNKYIGLLFVLMLAIGCNPTKKVVVTKDKPTVNEDAKKVYNPKTKQYEDANASNTKVDTVIWIAEDETKEPPLNDSDLAKTIPYSELKSSYNISLLLPLRGGHLSTSENRSSTLTDKFVSYYAGFRMGLEKLEREGIALDVDILDVGSTPVDQLIQTQNLSSSDLIIGPYFRSNIGEVAKLAKDYSIPMVTPWSSFQNFGEDNPYFILAKPGFDTYCQSIVDDIMKKYDPREVKVVVKSGDEYLYSFFHKHMESYGIQDTANSFKTYFVNDTTIELSATPVDSHLVENQSNVFIIPYYRRSDSKFVYSFLRRLSIGNANNEVIVYGMPQWKDRVEQDYDLYNMMKIYIPTVGFTNTESWDYQQIRKKYIREYSSLPNDDTMEAYDLIVYMGRMLFKYGKNFQYYLDAETYPDAVHYGFKFTRMELPLTSKSIDDRLIPRTGFENKYVRLIQLKDYTFSEIK